VSRVAELVALGNQFISRGDLVAARFHYQAALSLDPGNIIALSNLAASAGGSHDTRLKLSAVSIFRRILSLDPENVHATNNLGTLLMQLERYDEAKEVMLRAARLSPDVVPTWHNLALLMNRLGDYEAGLKYLDEVEGLGYSSPQIDNDRAHLLLSLGRFRDAYPFYEARWWQLNHLPPWDFHIPEWAGENIENKKVLVHAEQGQGDTFMTVRFLEEISSSKVVLAVQGGMIDLFNIQDWNDVDVVDVMNPFTSHSPESFSFHIPLMGLMRWLNIDPGDINPKPYLSAPKITLPPPLPDSNYFNVGICWASGTHGEEFDRRRRVSDLSLWLKLAENAKVRLWSLYRGIGEDEVERIGADALIATPILSYKSWSETAALISRLDLVISVDTAIVHLAAAMGKPTWLLSQYDHCWRWLGIETGVGLPWYNCLKIICAEKSGDWENQIQIASNWLEDFLKGDLGKGLSIRDRLAA